MWNDACVKRMYVQECIWKKKACEKRSVKTNVCERMYLKNGYMWKDVCVKMMYVNGCIWKKGCM